MHTPIGEIWLASGSVAVGYWEKTEETTATFQAYLQEGDGPFLRTGDLGFVHEGELFIPGRLKDLIIVRGRNLAPQDIERTVELCEPAMRPAHVAAVSFQAGGAERMAIVGEVKREVRRTMDRAGDVGGLSYEDTEVTSGRTYWYSVSPNFAKWKPEPVGPSAHSAGAGG